MANPIVFLADVSNAFRNQNMAACRSTSPFVLPNASFVTTAPDDDSAFALLDALGFPFKDKE